MRVDTKIYVKNPRWRQLTCYSKEFHPLYEQAVQEVGANNGGEAANPLPLLDEFGDLSIFLSLPNPSSLSRIRTEHSVYPGVGMRLFRIALGTSEYYKQIQFSIQHV